MEQEEKNYQPETRSRKFWRVVLGSMVGFVLASIITSVLGMLMFLGMIATFQKTASSMMSTPTNVKDNSVLLVDLTPAISERAVEMPFSFGDYMQEGLGLDNILAAIKAASGDSKIKGIYLKSSTVSASPASVKNGTDLSVGAASANPTTELSMHSTSTRAMMVFFIDNNLPIFYRMILESGYSFSSPLICMHIT